MRILIVTHYFPPEPGAPQTRLSGLAKIWSRGGDHVTVLTGFPNHPTGVIHAGYEGKIRLTEELDGYRIVRTWLYATRNERVLRKTLGHISFMISSVLLGTRLVGPCDVVVVSSPTFFSIVSAWVIARLKRARLVVEIRDLWPAAIVELGVLTNRWIIRILEAFEMWAYRTADLVVPVSTGFRTSIVGRGIRPEKVHVITNSVDLARFAGPLEDRGGTRASLGAGDGDVLVLYAGTHGSVYALPMVADVAQMLRGQPVVFALVGDGVAKPALEARVRELGLTNVTMLPAVPGEQVPRLIDASDICMLPLRALPMLDGVIAAKIFEYMAAGKAIVGSVSGETADLLRASGAVVVPPEDETAFAAAIAELAGDRLARQRLGETARRWVTEHYDMERLAQRYRALLAGSRTTDR